MGVSLISLISMILVAAGVLLVRWRSYLFGKTVEKAKAQEKTLETVKKANSARIDGSNDDKLRKRYPWIK